ncbi:hypothetical protein NVP1273O_04 [Vibrio phage 1.273.O._10N.286.54.C7]|nr:hypothetical protein NVP1273O_04 [Vibrio phage 1.273.O._10N.286.54.C7]
MKHKYAEMIKAKADNMELVLLTKRCESSVWGELNNHGDVTFLHEFDYFLCLPQHKEAVLNCLNGGESQLASISSGWLPANCGDPVEWGGEWWYMNPNGESRIKPKKEKRLIVYRNDAVYGPYLSIDDINTDFVLTGQVVEIEIEV